MTKKFKIDVLEERIAPAFPGGADANVSANAEHADNWHGFGDDHQANNEPGDTASDRHAFAGNATPSGKVPTDGSNG